jgi:hypothetical protein
MLNQAYQSVNSRVMFTCQNMRQTTKSTPKAKAWMCRVQCAAKFPGRCVFPWALCFLLGAAFSPGCCVFHSALPNLLPNFLSSVTTGAANFTVRYPIFWLVLPNIWQRRNLHRRYKYLALPIGTWNVRVRIHYFFRWLMMAETVVGSMITTYHLYRTLGMQKEVHQ